MFELESILDVQSLPDTREIMINQVGIKNILHPISFLDRAGKIQPTTAKFAMLVQLQAQCKGTHMSRFVEILHEQTEPLTVANFGSLAEKISQRLDTQQASITMQFSYFKEKQAPISRVKSLLDYSVTLSATQSLAQAPELCLEVQVPVTSLCPCSKEISLYGAHNQRSLIILQVKTKQAIWLEDLIDIAEQNASCELYGLLKRPDEKYVTEKAYNNPKFVEDMVRDIAANLQRNPHILAYKIESENFESIHNHSAYAMIESDNY